MRLGLIACSTSSGLGYQTQAYYEHLAPVKTMCVNISAYNGLEQHAWWYPDGIHITGFPKAAHLDGFLRDIDVVLTAETPYNYQLYEMARDRGIKTAVVYNYEFFDWFKHPEYPLPDLLIAPSMWNYDVIEAFANERGIKHTYLHHPVDREVFKYRQRDSKKFVHIAGKTAAYDRNGTQDFLALVPEGTLITQDNHLAKLTRARYRNMRVLDDVREPQAMYEYGDIMVLPRRYGGNCLPLNEALSCGLPVIMPDISPNNHLLPPEWLVKATVIDKFEPRTTVDIYAVDNDDFHRVMKWFEAADIAEESKRAGDIAQSISWEVMKERWIKELEAI